MKYFSDVTGEVYESVKALQEAEADYLAKAETTLEDVDDEAPEVTEEVTKEVTKPTKKQLAAEVDAAQEALEKANSELAIAEKKVEELSKEYLKACEEILTPAKQNVQRAQQAKYDAIAKFNEQYGAYQVVLTGNRAAQEMIRAIEDMNARTANMFRRFWF